MNYFKGVVIGLENTQNLNMVEFQVENDSMFMLSLELPNIELGSQVQLTVKPMNVAIAKRFSGSFSFSNKLFALVKNIEHGKILCSVKVDYKGNELEAVMSKNSIKNMHLGVGDTVVLFIKASDVSIKEIL